MLKVMTDYYYYHVHMGRGDLGGMCPPKFEKLVVLKMRSYSN
jgi:hypothetical protein